MNFDYKSHLAAAKRSVLMLERDGQPCISGNLGTQLPDAH